MKVLWWKATAAAICAIVLLAPVLRAQQQQSIAPILRMGRYDKSTEIAVTGTVQSVAAQKNSSSPWGTYLALRSGAITYNVHMGMFTSKNIPFAAGDQVQVTGSLISMRGSQILLARQVKGSSQTLTVRSPNGFVMRAHPAPQPGGVQR